MKDTDERPPGEGAVQPPGGFGRVAEPDDAKKKKKGKRPNKDEVQKELRQLTGGQGPDKPPVDFKKLVLRGAGVVAIAWIISLFLPAQWGWWPKAVAGAVTVIAAGGAVRLRRYLDKNMKIGALLKGADSEEARKKALEQLGADFKKDDTSAALAKAQLLMQDDPRAALLTLEAIKLDKQLAPVAAQVRAMRALIHLTLGEVQEAKALTEALDLGKQQEPKTRAMFATVASEAWARTGQAKKAIDTLDLFNPEDPDLAEVKAQMWRARAFAYAANNDIKGVGRVLRKLADMNPHLLGMFIGQKKVHPLLEREAKQLVMKMGMMPRRVVRR